MQNKKTTASDFDVVAFCTGGCSIFLKKRANSV